MNSNRDLQSCRSAFYASLARKYETGGRGACGGDVSRRRARHFRVRSVFVRCRNALIYKSPGESEAGEGTEEPPVIIAPGGKARALLTRRACGSEPRRKNIAVVRQPWLPLCSDLKPPSSVNSYRTLPKPAVFIEGRDPAAILGAD